MPSYFDDFKMADNFIKPPFYALQKASIHITLQILTSMNKILELILWNSKKLKNKKQLSF